MEKRFVSIGHGIGTACLGASDGALFRWSGGDCEDQRLDGGRVGLGGQAGAPGEEDIVVLDLGLVGDGEVESIF